MSHPTPKKCYITELSPVYNPRLQHGGWVYEVEAKNKCKQTVSLSDDYQEWSKESFFSDNKHILAGAIINCHPLLQKPDKSPVTITEEFFIELISNINYPKSVNDKLDNLLQFLVRQQKHDGQTILYPQGTNSEKIWCFGNYFKNEQELKFYLRTLAGKGFLVVKPNPDSEVFNSINLTHEGLNYYSHIDEENSEAKNCFIAMSFEDSNEIRNIREAIRNAITETGFNPIFIDEQHIESDKTINDAIIAELKRAKFCIADFTNQKHGVYFESGFALGQGKPVIYCCKKNDFCNSHFDLKHFAHILYSTTNELQKALINKINGWIK